MITFGGMVASKEKNLLTLRQATGEETKAELIRLADLKKWSLNQYAMEVLRDHVKKFKSKNTNHK